MFYLDYLNAPWQDDFEPWEQSPMSVWSVKIFVAPWVANFCFGGLENNTIFAMCDTNIVMARIAATGAIAPPV